jgi:predicted enzyme related to lactoylglutathione lyase
MTDVRDADAPSAQDNARDQAGTFIWYELMTTDAEGAKAFYEAVVPSWRVSEPSAEHQGYREINIAGGGHAGGLFPLTEDMQRNGAQPGWLAYIAVEDVDASARSIEQAGGTQLMPAFDIPGVGRIAMVADPQGVPFYVMRGAIDERSDVFAPGEDGCCGWNELLTSDPAAALSFYGGQFGWKSNSAMPMGELGEYRFLEHNGAQFGALFQARDGRPRWRFYFCVPSIARARSAAADCGGTIVVEPQQVPTGDYIIVGIDPQGAEFALVGKA